MSSFSSPRMNLRIAIIGGGAAGMMCAAQIHEKSPDAHVFLMDRNDGLGKKVIISGGGRCNVTTGIGDVKTVLTNYPRGAKFLSFAMHAFSPADVCDWFELHGVPLKTEHDLRVFPVSDDGYDIVRVFESLFRSPKTTVMLESQVWSVAKQGNEFVVYIKGNTNPMVVDKLVLTTGGQAFRRTGSTGDGYAFASSLGHSITPLAPSLNAFVSREKWPAEVSGLSSEKATITARRGKNPRITGPFVFTHRGVSGPAVFALSSLLAFETYDADTPLQITIDLLPDEVFDDLCVQFEKLVQTNGKRQFVNVLASLVPKSISEIIIRELGISETKRANEVAKKDIHRCVMWIKAVPMTVIQRGAGDEFVTAGGVDLTQIDSTSMESKLCPGLYFAGEILDIDGFTGGFNLQASWATGHLAGSHIGSCQS